MTKLDEKFVSDSVLIEDVVKLNKKEKNKIGSKKKEIKNQFVSVWQQQTEKQ